MIQKLHDKRMDEEPKTTTKGRLIETDLAKEKVTSIILVAGPTNMNSLWKLKSVLKPSYGVGIQPTRLLRA